MTTSTTAPAAAARTRQGFSIAIMGIAAFVIVTTEYVVLGLLPALSRDLGISIAAAGQLVTLFAFTVMLFGPPLTAVMSRWNRKRLFIGILLVFCAANVASAVAPDIVWLGVARFAAALLLPVFWGTASESAGQLAGPGHEGQAVSQIYLGISAALVFGVPVGTLVGDALGWRATFWMLAALSALLAAAIARYMPALPTLQRPSGAAQAAILKEPRFLAQVLLSTLVFTAMFTAYTYLADMLERLAGIAPNAVGWWLMGFGVVGMVGNYLGGRWVDRSPLGATIVCLAVLGAAMLVAAPAAADTVLLGLALVAWALAHTALFPISQVRVMQAGAAAPAFAGSMNVSAANAGTGLGALLGGLGVQQLGLASLGVVGAAIAALGIALALAMRRRRPAVAAGQGTGAEPSARAR